MACAFHMRMQKWKGAIFCKKNEPLNEAIPETFLQNHVFIPGRAKKTLADTLGRFQSTPPHPQLQCWQRMHRRHAKT